MYEIIVGRDAEDRQKFGIRGTFLLGKHYVKMGQTTSLSNEILMDVAKSHVVFVTGKRGSGKSYSMFAIVEGMMSLPREITSKLAVIVFDTMGIFWTVKYENKKDAALLREWHLAASGLPAKVYVPEGSFESTKEKGIPVDFPFSIRPQDLTAGDWCTTFALSPMSPVGAFVSKIVDSFREQNCDIADILNAINEAITAEEHVKTAAHNLFSMAASWGLFSKEGTPLSELAVPGQITVLDVSSYAFGTNRASVRALVIGLVSKHLFAQRMQARKEEELREVKSFSRVVRSSDAGSSRDTEKEVPLVWLFVDEAHEFLPKEGTTPASDVLQTILREGRQPGISLVLASQQPGQIHTDVMTQSDIVIAHHITAKIDVEALGALMQSYMREGLDKALADLPDVKGAALLFDDTNERLYPIRVRPRIAWHGGGSPTLLSETQAAIR